MLIAHGPIAYLSNEKIQKKEISRLNTNQQLLITIFALLFGILPDFDLFYLLAKDLPAFTHHSLITHTPVFYISIWIILRICITPVYNLLNKNFGKILDRHFLKVLTNTFLIATISHLLADFLVSGIPLFYPISMIEFSVLGNIFESNLFTGYYLTPFFTLEILIVSIFIYSIVRRFFKQTKFFRITAKILIALSALFIPLSGYIFMNTYNHGYMYDQNNEVNYDTDHDAILDSNDSDIGNTGESNILKADEDTVLDSALDIINSNKWASLNKDSLLSKTKYTLGAFSSYRIISQAYYSIGLPIEPVLRDFSIKEYGFDTYAKEYKYPLLLFDYLYKEDKLIELNLESEVNIPSSKIFFLVEDDTLINLGITLEGNYMALVIESDKRLNMHSYESVREYYEDQITNIYIQE